MGSNVYHLFVTTAHKHKMLIKNMLWDEGISCSPHILLEIAENEGITQKELSELLGIKPASVTVTIEKLIGLGFIHREIDEKDLRIKRIYITEKGKDIIEQSEKVREKANKIAFGNFTKEEKETFRNLLQKLEKNLEVNENEETF